MKKIGLIILDLAHFAERYRERIDEEATDSQVQVAAEACFKKQVQVNPVDLPPNKRKRGHLYLLYPYQGHRYVFVFIEYVEGIYSPKTVLHDNETNRKSFLRHL